MVKVLLFGLLRERCGGPFVMLDPTPSTVAELKAALAVAHPFLGERWKAIRVAVNQQFAGDDAAVRDGDEIALIPPVAGGAPHPRVELGDTPLSLDRAVSQVLGPRQGGLCVFGGMVRDHAMGRAVVSIEYSAYDAMARGVMERIVMTAEEQHSATVACHHRVGHLKVGELAVVIAAAAPHREACFAACRQVIEELKKDVPIWKKEFGQDGAVWVGMGP